MKGKICNNVEMNNRLGIYNRKGAADLKQVFLRGDKYFSSFYGHEDSIGE